MSTIQDFPLPLSLPDRQVAAVCLASGQSVRVDGHHLSRDADLDLIWGTDPYGVDYIASRGVNAEACLAAIDRALERSNPDMPSPAEWSW